jgi:hypothetical protein
VDAYDAGRLSRSFEPLFSAKYFAPGFKDRFTALGMDSRMAYFATRAAPMGAVGAKVVIATFYYFNPDLVAEHIPAAWQVAEPDVVSRLHQEVLDSGLPSLLGPELAYSPEIAHAAGVLRRAAESIPSVEGRPLYAGHAELAWPEPAYAQLLHAFTLLREYRGDGHVIALASLALNGLEAHITHTASGIGFAEEFALWQRGWTRPQWDEAVDRLRTRGILTPDGALTNVGVALRTEVEDLTDALGLQPWRAITDDDAATLGRVATALNRLTSLFPAGSLGPRYGQHR